ncbi:MAG: hypothetical protein ACK4JE_03315, partial [Endomicrobiia bacterium]
VLSLFFTNCIKEKIFPKNHILYLSFGLSFGIIWWILFHIIIPTPDVFFYQWKHYWGRLNQPAFLLDILSILKKEFYRYYSFFWQAKYYRNMLLLILFLASVISGLKSKQYSDKKILYLLGISVVHFTFVTRSNTTFYLILIFPFLILLSVKFIFSLRYRFLKNIILTILAVLFLSEFSYIILKFKDGNYYGFIKKLKTFIPENTVVMGHLNYWFGFALSNKYFSDVIIEETRSNSLSKYSFQEWIKEKNIEYIIVTLSTWAGYSNKKEEFEKFLNLNCVKIGEVKDNYYGTGDPSAGYGEVEFITEVYKVL